MIPITYRKTKKDKRYLFDKKVDGKDRHLFHLTRTYRELFRYCQLCNKPPKEFIFPKHMDAVDSEGSLRNIHEKIPKEPTNKNGKIIYSYDRRRDSEPDEVSDEFWDLNKELFLEPIEEKKPVEVLKSPISDDFDKDTLILKIDLTDTDSALYNTKIIINKHRRKFTPKSKAQFKLGTHQKYIRLQTLLAYRACYVYREQHLPPELRKNTPSREDTYNYLVELDLVNEIYMYLDKNRIRDKWQEARKVSFYCSQVRKIIKHIEAKKFSFP